MIFAVVICSLMANGVYSCYLPDPANIFTTRESCEKFYNFPRETAPGVQVKCASKPTWRVD